MSTKPQILTIPYVGISMMCMACFLPPVRLYMDALYLPKCHLLLAGLSVCLLSFPFTARICGMRTSLYMCMRCFMVSYSIMALFECLFVFFDVIFNGRGGIGCRGTFDNPSGLALSLCVALPMTAMLGKVWHCKGIMQLCAVACGCMALTVALTESRTGVVCCVVYAFVFVTHKLRIAIKSKAVRCMTIVVAAAALLVCALLFVFSKKSDSTSGRYFILQQTCRLVEEHPLTGWGKYGFEREYMLRQADFFHHNPQSEYSALADDLKHPLNEYMYLWVEYGIAAPIILLLVIVLTVWNGMRNDCVRQTGLPLALLALAVFCLFSYPFHYQSSWLVSIMSLASVLMFLPVRKSTVWYKTMKCACAYAAFVVGLITACYLATDSFHEMEWRKAYVESVRRNDGEALEKYESVSGYFDDDWHFHYSYSLAAFMASDMEKALVEIEECMHYCNGYDIQLLAGDICLNMQRYDESVAHYVVAADMCPARFAPLEGLYRAYDELNMIENRDSVARMIAEKQVKVYSSDVERIRRLGLY